MKTICIILLIILFLIIILISLEKIKEKFKIEPDFSNYYINKTVLTHCEFCKRKKLKNGYKGSKCIRDCDCYPGLKCRSSSNLFQKCSELIPTSGNCA